MSPRGCRVRRVFRAPKVRRVRNALRQPSAAVSSIYRFRVGCCAVFLGILDFIWFLGPQGLLVFLGPLGLLGLLVFLGLLVSLVSYSF